MKDLIDRQAAIDAINGVLVEDDACKVWFRLALQNLPSAQPEKRTEKRTETHACDCISREAAIDLLKQMRKDGDMIPWEGKDVFARIRKLPSAQPERKRGKWIEDDDGWDEVIWRCSECDAVFTLVDGTPEENEYYFCPHCGADMRGEQDG